MSFKKAVKHQAKLRLALCGLAGSGKSFSSLAIASGIAQQMRANGHGEGRIAVIDSERGSASLYADRFEFDVCELESFSPLAYVEKIHEAERAGYDIIIADSISHAWAGKGGALEQKDQAADRGGNSWTAWRSVTPKHNTFVDAMVGCKAHFIATMRTKMEYLQEADERGKMQIKRVGLAAIQREGMEYEFTLVGDVDHSHTLKITKTRVDGIDINDQFERPGEAFAQRLYAWLMQGAPTKAISEVVILDRDQVMADKFDETMQAIKNGYSDSAIPSLEKRIDAAVTVSDFEALIPDLKAIPEGEIKRSLRAKYNERRSKAQQGAA